MTSRILRRSSTDASKLFRGRYSGGIRLVVARCARDALSSRSSVRDLPGFAGETTRSYKLCDTSDRPPFPIPPGSRISTEVQRCSTNMVHGVVRYQESLDGEWHQVAIDAIRVLGLVPADDSEGSDKFYRMCQSPFRDIVVIAAISHGINAAFLARGDDVLPLPTPQETEGAPAPTNLDISSLVQRRIRRDESVGCSPYIF